MTVTLPIRILAWFHIVLGGLLLAIGTPLCLVLGLSKDHSVHEAFFYIAPPFLCVAIVYLIPAVIGGIGLLRGRSWAKVLALILSSLLTLLIPLGTVLGLYGFWALLRQESPSTTIHVPQAAQQSDSWYAANGPYSGYSYQSRSSSPLGLLTVMAGVGAGMFLGLKLGFILHHDPQPYPFRSLPLIVLAGGILLAGLIVLFVLMARSINQAAKRAQAQRNSETARLHYQEEKRKRVAKLAADPARAKYAPLVERGELWTDEDIAYSENPALTNTCAHLHPIERAIRDAGIDVRRSGKTSISAKCCIDFPVLQRAFGTSPTVRYSEYYQDERGAEYPTAFLMCDEHRSAIHTVHSAEARAANAPRFPALVKSP